MPSEEAKTTTVVLSDIDGVLIDSAHAVWQSYKSAFKIKGINLPDYIFWENIWGNSWRVACLEMENTFCGEQDWEAIHYLKGQLFEDLLQPGDPCVMQQNDLICTALESLFFRADADIELVTGGSQKASILKMQWLAKVRSRPAWTEIKLHHSMDKKHPDSWRTLLSPHVKKHNTVVVIEDDTDVERMLKNHFPTVQVLNAAFGEHKMRKERVI